MGSLVSVYLPTHNRADMVERAINSVLCQTYDELELIIVNDGSLDHTADVLEEFRARDSRVRVIHKARAEGACAARNAAINAARGTFVSGLDDDDAMVPHAMETYISNWRDDFRFLCAETRQDGRLFPMRAPRSFGREELRRYNVVGNQIFTRTSLLRGSLFDPSLKAWQDYDAWLRLIGEGEALKLPDELYVVSQAQDRQSITNSPAARVGALQFLTKHAESIGDDMMPWWMMNDLLNRGQRIPLWLQFAALAAGDWKRVLQYHVRSNAMLDGLKTAVVRFRGWGR